MTQIKQHINLRTAAVLLLLTILSVQGSWAQKRSKSKSTPIPTVVLPPATETPISGGTFVYGKEDHYRDSLFLEATAHYISDRTEDALQLYRLLLEKDPENATAAFQISNLLADGNRFAEAIVYAEKACLLQPGNEWFQLLRAQLYKTTRQFKKAGETFALLHQLNPKNLEYAYEEANMYVFLKDLSSAIAIYDRLQAQFGYTDEWSMQKYKLYAGMNNVKAARNEIEKISAAIPGQSKYLEILAQMHMQEKDYKQAYRYLKKILELKPDDPYIHVSLADYYRNTGDFNAAYRSLEKAIENVHLDFKTKLNILKTYYTEQDERKPKGDLFKQARHLFAVLNRVHPQEAEGFFTHGKFLVLLDDVPTAIPLLKKSVTLDSTVYGAWEMLLFAANQVGDTTLLKQAGKIAAGRFPEQPAPFMYLAVAAILDGDNESAVALAENCHKRNMGINPYMEKVVLQILGDGYFVLNQHDKSLDAYRRLYATDPADKYVRNNYAYYLAVTGRELEMAEKMAEKLCQEEPQNATFLDTYAWTLYRNGNYGKAKEIMEKALKYSDGKESTLWEHYGDILQRSGQTPQAIEAWKKAVFLLPQEERAPIERKIEQPDLTE